MGKKRKRPAKEDAELRSPLQKRAKAPPNGPGKEGKKVGEATRTPGDHPVLSRYYSRVVTLRQYILDRLQSCSRSKRKRIALFGKKPNMEASASTARIVLDSTVGREPQLNGKNVQSIAGLLDSTLVGVVHDASQGIQERRQREFATFAHQSQNRSSPANSDAASLQGEIVDFVISNLFNRNFSSYRKPQHILVHGFQRAAPSLFAPQECGALPITIPGVAMQYPNQNVTALKSAPWTDVLALLGQSGGDIMISLLLDCGIFSCLDRVKRIYYQISGVPLSELEIVDTVQSQLHTEPSRVTRYLATGGGGKESILPRSATGRDDKAVLHKPNSIIFVRRRMLYARPALNAKSAVRFGLRHIHVLNRFPYSTPRDLSHTVHVMKYIFPRQFGLHNVFTSEIDRRETVQPFKDYTLREEEIASVERQRRSRLPSLQIGAGESKESFKIPKRLRGKVVELVQKLQRSNKCCSYSELLRYYCPIEETKPPAFSVLAQEGLVDSENGTKPFALKQKSCLTDHSTPASSVSAFCRAVLQRLVPDEFYGVGDDGKSNRRVVLKNVDRFVRMSRFESLSLHEVCKGLKVTCVSWLDHPNSQTGVSDHASHKLSLPDLRKRTEILNEFIYYIFDSLLIPLIRSNFYVTESQVHRNRLFFFRHDVWRRLTEQPLANIKSSMFEEMKRERAHRILSGRSLGYGSMRLLPKAVGARPIINLRRRMVGKKTAILGPSINSMMTPVFNMLSCERAKNPELLGSSIFSIGDMYPRLKSFKERLFRQQGCRKDDQSHNRRLFFVKLDIRSCFDTIPQHKLVALIKKLVSEDAYHVTKHVEIRPPESCSSSKWQDEHPRQGKPVRKFVSKAVSAERVVSLPELVANGAANRRRNTIFVDTAMQKDHAVEDLLELLEEHVRNNLVKIGKKYYRQRNGIPQGSVLSSLLCSFFYGRLEREVLGFLDCDDTILLRLIDDFLLITLKADIAMRFLQVMMDGQPEYGISVNPSKSLVNFEATVNGIKIPRLLDSVLFPYCGNLIDTHSLELHKDRGYVGEYSAFDVSDTLTVESSRNPGRAFHRKTLAFFRLQTYAMFLDTSHNAPGAVLSGIYASFVETAIKMYRYLKALPTRARPSTGLVVKTISDLINSATTLIQSKRPKSVAPQPKPDSLPFQCAVKRQQVQYLAASAFYHVLQRKQARFVPVLDWLDHIRRASRPTTDGQAVQMRRIIKAGNAIFDELRY
ncbi:hypothetical protein Egran_05849 [Elaphomyces granulatus]|uniref:Telomerase reverse transcriptase n=1 Tax=Elaphomyces granulatus TaxID=519963 RepID=A0A232LQE3_9EURO|nr:hypothetical protein Egran_05849 [Elaphomyces granulatus]